MRSGTRHAIALGRRLQEARLGEHAMRVLRRSACQRRTVVPLLIVCFLSGCYKWSAEPAPQTLDKAPERARVTLLDGRVVQLRSVEIRGDSVAGFAKAGAIGDTLHTYALEEVLYFEVRKGDTRKNVTIAAVLAVTAGLAIGMAISFGDCGIFECKE